MKQEIMTRMRKSALLRRHGFVIALGAIMLLGACGKKKLPPPPPPPPPEAVAPTASLSANPNTIEPGQSTTLTWQTTGATDVSIEGIGPVDQSGSRQVTPTDSTTYHLVAKGPGGSQDATARVTVNTAPAQSTSNATEEELFSQNVKDVYFDYDKYDIRASEQGSLQADAQFLQQHANIHITVEGHSDERGSTEYNLALGTNRADAVKNALIQAGVAGNRIKTISYGKEKPFCSVSNETCWQQNRRGHFVYEK